MKIFKNFSEIAKLFSEGIVLGLMTSALLILIVLIIDQFIGYGLLGYWIKTLF